MTDDRSTPGWSALDRARDQLRADGPTSPYATLSDEQLLRAIEAARRGEPDPRDVTEALRAAVRRMPAPPAWLAEMSDAEIMDALKRDANEVRASAGADVTRNCHTTDTRKDDETHEE